MTRERWQLLGFLAAVTALRLWYIQHGFLELAPDEAHYWEWSRRLDWSYYSKGPFVAYLIAASTAVGGSTEFFVRLPAVVLSAGTTIVVFRLLEDLFADGRVALATAILLHTIPLFAVGSMLMTIDPPLVFFWTLMLWLVYRALLHGRKVWWYAAGVPLGCGLLSKYAMGFLPLSLWLYLATSTQQRKWLRQKEPYLMLLIGLAFLSPVIIWNVQHGGVSLKHVMGQAEVQRGLQGPLSLGRLGEFLGSQALILSPLLFGWILVAMALSLRAGVRERDDRWLFLFWGWAPTFTIFLLLSLRQKVQANWAAPAYVTALLTAVVYLAQRWWPTCKGWQRRITMVAGGFTVVVALGMTLALHDPTLFARWGLPLKADPTSRLKGWRTLGAAVGALTAQMPVPPFLLSDRYQISSELAFYTPGQPQSYSVNLGRRQNQYDVWDGLPALAGRDAVYVQLETPGLPPPLQMAFESCTQGEPVVIRDAGRELRRFYLFRCTRFSGIVPQPTQLRY